MLSRGLPLCLRMQSQARQSVLRHQQCRGKALTNWKTPSMDEYTIPKEPWAQVHAKENARFNMQLAVGTAMLVGTIFASYALNLIPFNLTPYHLMKNDK